MLTVSTPPGFAREREYIIGVVFSEFLEVEDPITIDAGAAAGTWRVTLPNGTVVTLPDVFFAVTQQNQQLMIRDLQGKNIPYVVMTSGTSYDSVDGLHLKDRIPLVWEYVHRYYEYDRSIGSIVIYRRKGGAVPAESR